MNTHHLIVLPETKSGKKERALAFTISLSMCRVSSGVLGDKRTITSCFVFDSKGLLVGNAISVLNPKDIVIDPDRKDNDHSYVWGDRTIGMGYAVKRACTNVAENLYISDSVSYAEALYISSTLYKNWRWRRWCLTRKNKNDFSH